MVINPQFKTHNQLKNYIQVFKAQDHLINIVGVHIFSAGEMNFYMIRTNLVAKLSESLHSITNMVWRIKFDNWLKVCAITCKVLVSFHILLIVLNLSHSLVVLT